MEQTVFFSTRIYNVYTLQLTQKKPEPLLTPSIWRTIIGKPLEKDSWKVKEPFDLKNRNTKVPVEEVREYVFKKY